jgi:hypothetical protein
MEVAVVSLDNSVGTEIYGDGTVGLDYLVEAGSHSLSWDDLSIRDYTCWKRDHTYARVVH